MSVRDALNDMAGPAAPPRSNGELVFESPWQGRAFAIAVGLVERLGVGWEAFRGRLIAEITSHPSRPYYESWVAALESLVVDSGLVDPGALATRAAALEP